MESVSSHKQMNENSLAEVLTEKREQPGARSLEAWRERMLLALENALEFVCKQYRGRKNDELEALLKYGYILKAYFILTQSSQEIANDTKTILFLKIGHLAGVIGRNIVCEDMKGMEVTQRTGTWRKCLTSLVPWWSASVDLEKILTFKQTDHEWSANQTAQYSSVACEVGTFIHHSYGKYIAEQCVKMFDWGQLECFVPGRMIHFGLPWIGITPDAIAVVDERAYHHVLQKMMHGETVRHLERRGSAPWLTIEIKTLHGPTNKDAEGSATIQEQDIEQLCSVYENDQNSNNDATKEAAIALLVRKLEIAKWIPNNLYAENVDYALEKNVLKLKKSVDSKKRKTCAFFKKSTIVYPTKQFRKLCVESVGAELYPNLAKLPLCSSVEPPRKKYKWQNIVELKQMVSPGKACLMVYKVGESEANELLFHLVWDEAPLMLTLNSAQFNQVMEQHATARQLNEDVKSLFAIVLRSYRDPTTKFGENPIQLAMVYAYDVGIQSDAVDAFSDVVTREIALASQGVEDSETLHAMLLKETSLEDRKRILYRRASGLDKLAEPTDIAIESYRKACKDGWNEPAFEEWSDDDDLCECCM